MTSKPNRQITFISNNKLMEARKRLSGKEDQLVSRFAQQMQIELEKNIHKGSIVEWTGIEKKLLDLEYHKAKLMFALKEDNQHAIKEYLADCGNILMSIGHEAGVYESIPYNSGVASEMKEGIFKTVPIDKQTLKKLIK